MAWKPLILLFFLRSSCAHFVISTDPSPVKTRPGSDMLLKCLLTPDKPPVNPAFLAFAWKHKEEKVVEFQREVKIFRPGVQVFTGDFKNGNLSLLLPSITMDDEGDYSCTVTYNRSVEKKNISLQIEVPPEITVHDTVVPKDTLSVIKCSIQGFYPQNITVQWLRDGNIINGSTLSPLQKNEDNTFSVDSDYVFMPTSRDSSSTYSCRVSHSALQQPIQKDIRLQLGAAPEVIVNDQLVVKDAPSVLHCSVQRFYPENITILWLQDGKVLNGSFISQLQMNPDNTFSVEAYFIFTPSCSDVSSTFSCQVFHIALRDPLQKNFRLMFANAEIPAWKVTLVMLLMLTPLMMIIGLEWHNCRKGTVPLAEERRKGKI
nr:PREDICTED: tyrosine-protein phosphatase non-receptor type substrate 1-like [Latimeria chalumnae]|eukprot:XP_014352944.1 PREDICTED: tyrosine-protein phosphatase non-receptor type substrate 1-like [Latimeria chalumnae]